MLPPAAKPTSTRTGLVGQFCAKADGAASDAANAAPDVSSERREMNGMVMVRITLFPQQCSHMDWTSITSATTWAAVWRAVAD
jgi:hypothetical protein